MRISSLGNVDTRGSNTVYPRQTTKYLLTAIGINGYSISRSINITVTQAVVSSTSNNTNSTNNTTKNTVTNNSTNTTKNVTESSDNQTSALASNALFGSNGFLPSSLFGWLFFAVLILLAVVLWRKLYVSDEDKHHSTLKHA